MSADNKTEKEYHKSKNSRLIISIIIDVIGNISYFLPAAGESIDAFWAPVSGVFLYFLYRFRKQDKIAIAGGLINLTEEAIPFTDIIPTATALWIYKYIFRKDKTKKDFYSIKTNNP